jgi:hypothetical protein
LTVFAFAAERIQPQSLPVEPAANFGSDVQTTFACAAAWIASNSCGATTARKFLI